MLLVSQHSGLPLSLPEACIGPRHNSPVLAIVHMPVTTMYEYDLLQSGEDQIRLSWKIGAMQSISEAKGVDSPAHNHLRFRVPRSNGRHIAASLIRSVHVGHCLTYSLSYLSDEFANGQKLRDKVRRILAMKRIGHYQSHTRLFHLQ